MATSEQVQSAVIAFLIHDRLFLLNKISPLLLQRQEALDSEETIFHHDIEVQFRTLLRREIAEEIAKTLNINPEEVFLIVENMNVDEFIGNFQPSELEEDEEESESPEEN
jgi:hypothetical protein